MRFDNALHTRREEFLIEAINKSTVGGNNSLSELTYIVSYVPSANEILWDQRTNKKIIMGLRMTFKHIFKEKYVMVM